MPEKTNYSEWYLKHYHELDGYGVWLKGNEINRLPSTEYGKRPYGVLFARLSTYQDVSTSFTHSFLYEIAAGEDSIYPDLAFLPGKTDADIFKRDNVPWLVGTGAKYGPGGYRLVAFSDSIVQEIINIPHFLVKSGLPLLKSERMKDETIPLVIMGGNNALYSSVLWNEDPLVDGIFVGEDAATVKAIFSKCVDGWNKKLAKREILASLTEISGFILPENPATVKKIEVTSDCGRSVTKGIVPYVYDEIGDGYLEISHGCRGFCSFCAENWARKPYKDYKADKLIEMALEMKAEMGLERINIFSFNFNMHKEFYRLITRLSSYFKNIGLKSQRFEMLATQPEMVQLQSVLGKMTFSCGLEGISQRLRKYLNKNLEDSSLYTALATMFKIRARELKIFVLATGLETDADLREFESLVKWTRSEQDRHRAKTRVIISVTPLVRFPWTPLEFADAPEQEKLDKITARILSIAAECEYEGRAAIDTREYIVSQILLRARDKTVSAALLKATVKTDFVYYRTIPSEFFSEFIRGLGSSGKDISEFLKGCDYGADPVPPWARIGTGIERKTLWEIFEKNRKFEESGGPLAGISIDRLVSDITAIKERIKVEKLDIVKSSLNVRVGDGDRGLPRKYFGARLARAIMKSDRRLIKDFVGYEGSFMDTAKSDGLWITGEDRITLLWKPEGEKLLNDDVQDVSFIAKVNLYLENNGSLLDMRLKSKETMDLEFRSPFKFIGQDYFRKMGLRFTLFKNSPAEYRLEFTKDSIKKKIISECVVTRLDDMTVVRIKPSEKFAVEEFMNSAFAVSGKSGWVRTTARVRLFERE